MQFGKLSCNLLNQHSPMTCLNRLLVLGLGASRWSTDFVTIWYFNCLRIFLPLPHVWIFSASHLGVIVEHIYVRVSLHYPTFRFFPQNFLSQMEHTDANYMSTCHQHNNLKWDRSKFEKYSVFRKSRGFEHSRFVALRCTSFKFFRFSWNYLTFCVVKLQVPR